MDSPSARSDTGRLCIPSRATRRLTDGCVQRGSLFGTIFGVQLLKWSGALAGRALTDRERSQLTPELGPFLLDSGWRARAAAGIGRHRTARESRTPIGKSGRPCDPPSVSAQFGFWQSNLGSNHSAAGAYSWDERETQISLENDQGRSLDRCRKYWIWPRLACREFCDRGRG